MKKTVAAKKPVAKKTATVKKTAAAKKPVARKVAAPKKAVAARKPAAKPAVKKAVTRKPRAVKMPEPIAPTMEAPESTAMTTAGEPTIN